MAITLAEEIAALRIANVADDELRNTLEEIKRLLQLLGGGGTTVVYSATLAADLNAGDTVTLNGKTYSGAAIRSGYKLPSGATIYGAYNGTNYTILAADVCEVPQ